MKMSFLVIGAGSWGTAFAVHLSRLHPNIPTYLTGRDEEQLHHMQTHRENKRYLPHIIFPAGLTLAKNIEPIIPTVENIIIAVPSHAFRETLQQIKPFFSSRHQKLFWITKGLDAYDNKHTFLHTVALDILGKELSFGIISGPSFAKEVAMELPTAVTLAGKDKNDVTLFHSPAFRIYYSEDIIGVQLGGAVKNVLAVGVGIAEGLGCGANAQAALITRGLSEMMRLGNACQADNKTLMGLSGVGDLILTCTNNQSRNRRFGIALGQNHSRENAEKSIGQVVEGIQTAKEIYGLSLQYKIDMPITEQVYKLLYENLSAQQALKNLLLREPKIESL
jgi:glycerol-3-phosphate dehydrogenase (NAD(P)+)